MTTIDQAVCTLDAKHAAQKTDSAAIASRPFVPRPGSVEAMIEAMESRGYSRDVCPSAARALADWLVAVQARRQDRGLFLYGPPGLGKTMFFRIIAHTPIWTAPDVVTAWEAHGMGHQFDSVVYGLYRERDILIPPHALIIDDLGQEPLGVRYGIREQVLTRVICARYRHWQDYQVRTHATTNLPLPDLLARYGMAVLDRLREMCVFVEFSGKSARKG